MVAEVWEGIPYGGAEMTLGNARPSDVERGIRGRAGRLRRSFPGKVAARTKHFIH